jgi:photosystem II stability/assembly factor-like uncharacterized protein
MKKFLSALLFILSINIASAQFVIVLTPDGGQTFAIGSQQTITWASIGINQLDIEYSIDNGATFISIDTSVSVFPSSYTWTVTGPASSNAIIRLTESTTAVVSDVSNATFNIVNPSLQITYPTSGLIFNPGQQINVTWSGNIVGSEVCLLFSSDNGSNYDTIIANAPNTFNYNWTIPPVASTTCRIKVLDVSSPSVQQNSDAFTIEALPSNGTVLTPNGGETLNSTTTYNITWNSTGTSIVDLEYTINGGTTWQVIDQQIPALPGSYAWTVPSANSSNAKVRLKNAINNLVLDESNNFFTIVQPIPTLELITPFGFENWAVNSLQTIQWSYSFLSTIKIEYSIDGGNTFSLIAASVDASDLSFEWTVPSTVSANCFIKISDNNSTLTNQNASAFNIINPSVTVIAPNGGEILNPNSIVTVNWSGVVASGLIKIERTTNNGTTWNVIANNLPNTGAFQWTVPNTPSTNCRIRISDALFPAVNDQSNSNFTISAPTPIINLITPNGGELIAAGTTYTIQWTSVNIANIKIDLSTDNGLTWNVIEPLFPAASGSFIWQVPNFISDSVLIKLSNAANVNVNDVSNSLFEIYSPTTFLDLIYPVGGEQIYAGITSTITWNSLDVDFVTIEYSINNGINWELIASGIPASQGSYNWMVPNILIGTVKVRIRDLNQPGINDQSAFYFSINQPTISLNGFSAGSSFNLFSNINLIWVSTGLNNQTLRLEYSANNGINWTTFASGISNTGIYNWLINCPPAPHCKFKISVESNPTIFSVAQGSVAVTTNGPAITVLTPSPNETLASGSSYNITWNSYGINFVRIEYSLNGDSIFQLITPFTPAATGSYIWSVPANLNAINCKIKISNAANTALSGITPFSFSIQTGQFFVTSGSIYVIYNSGENQPISWYTTSTSPYVDLHYSTDSINWTLIASHYQNSGMYNWSIPYINTDTVWYRVSDYFNPNISDVNDAPLKIILTDSLLALTQPASSSIIQSGTPYNITWNSFGVASVDIEFSDDNGSTWSTVAINVNANLHQYVWQVPNNITNNALIRIKNSTFPTQSSQNTATFTISNFFLTLSSPNGGENLNNGSNYYITWQSVGIDFVDIFYSTDGGASYNIIDSNVYNIGYFNWQINASTGSNCKIKIADSNNQFLFDESNAAFSINSTTPTITLLSPNGSEQLLHNTGQYITWQSSGISNIDVSYSLNGGATYIPLASNIPSSPAYYFWLVPDTFSLSAKIKISAVSNPSINDVSNNNFTISNVGSQVTLTSPVGGEIFNSSSYQMIKWNHINSPFVKLYYSINGGTSYNFINAAFNDSVYIWEVPAVSSAACRIKVEDGNNPAVFDASSAVFSINNQAVSTNIIQIDSLSNTNLCAGGSFTLSYDISGSYNTGNHFRVHLSDPSGNFTSFTDIGGISSTTSGSIQCNIPQYVLSGNAYSIRVVSDNPVSTAAVYSYGSLTINKANADFSSDKQLVLFPNTAVSFISSASASAINSSNWNTGNGGNYSTYSAQHQYNQAGKYDVSHVVTDSLGCTGSITKTRYIKVEHPFACIELDTDVIEDIVDIATENQVYVCAILSNGNCVVSSDSGKTWMLTYTNSSTTKLNSVSMFNNAWYITTDNGTFLKSTDKGLTWIEVTFNNNESIRDLYFISQNNILAAGNNGKALRFNGTIWQNQNTGTNNTLNKIGFNNSNAFIVGDSGTVLKQQNNTWVSIPCPVNVNLNSINFKDSLTGYIVTDWGFILKTNNGGNNWNVSLSGVDEHFTDVMCSADTTWAVATGGIIYKSVDNGNSWNRFSVGTLDDLNSIIYDNNKGYITGNNGLLRAFNTPVFVPVVNATQHQQKTISMSCYPNPTADKLFIDFNEPITKPISIIMNDIYGKKIFEKGLTHLTHSTLHSIDMSAYSDGIYFITITYDNSAKTMKVVKSN